jgi:hypothetical protein
MAYVTHVYGPALVSVFNKQVDIDSDTLKVMLVNGYTYSKTHQYKDVSITNESSGSGYTAGGATITSVTSSFNSTSNRWTFTGANVSWPSNTAPATGAVVYDDTPASSKPLLVYIDFGGSQTPLGLQWATDGIMYIPVPV